MNNAEQKRLEECRNGIGWKRWGPYLSERQWGTVREDYSPDGNAWDYFTHDQARSRAYRWGEDGLAGYSDDKQNLCFAVALWNGYDPILKERLFGLTNSEGNHGEDVKEYYFYLDSTPTHSYMKYLYKYPQREFPYRDLIETNRARTRHEMEYELLDTNAFSENRYFDVFVEYAKASPEDTLIVITAHNRGPETAQLDVLPTLWFRNTWSVNPRAERPSLERGASGSIHAVANGKSHTLQFESKAQALFTENETNEEHLFGRANASPYVKDAFHRYVIQRDDAAVNPAQTGTKAAVRLQLQIEPGKHAEIRLRLTSEPGANALGTEFESTLAKRRAEADEFYESLTPPALCEEPGADARNVMRQALAGMLWTKQYYLFDVDRWLDEHGNQRRGRNGEWFHMINDDIISMPDKWEYPWYAAWDLAFHTVALAMVDLDFAKQQLKLMLRAPYQHPNGQIPAYEWNFGDVNPPVHAWATLFVYSSEKEQRGAGDLDFLKQCFQKLLLNFTWWVNRKDQTGKNVFQGGFLGLDNIGVFDRSAPLPTGGHLEQADGTAWMALFCQNMLEIALELAVHDPCYEELAVKFGEHFLWIASAMDRSGDHHDEMWDEEDGFFYDLLRFPNGDATRLRIRSLVGLLPLCATTVISRETAERSPEVLATARQFLARHTELIANIAPPQRLGVDGRRLFAILNEDKLRRVLGRLLDEREFLGAYGIRSLSKAHEAHPYEFHVHGEKHCVAYLPAESDTGMFGGNSNWRGPVWMPANMLLIRALLQFYLYYGDDFTVECPTGSGRLMNLFEVSREIGTRLIGTFTRGADGRRPVYGQTATFQNDPHWRDYILFYEYFHGDNGAGIGASHQTGWTGIIARLIQMFGHIQAPDVLGQGQTRPTTQFYRKETASAVQP